MIIYLPPYHSPAVQIYELSYIHFRVHIILLNVREIFIGRKKDLQLKCTQHCYSGMQIKTAKTTTTQKRYFYVILNGAIFPKFYSILFPMLDMFYLSSLSKVSV